MRREQARERKERLEGIAWEPPVAWDVWRTDGVAGLCGCLGGERILRGGVEGKEKRNEALDGKSPSFACHGGQRMGQPQDHLLGGVRGIEEHSQEWLCYRELE